MTQKVERVVILGGGTAGWLAASMLACSRRAKAGPLEITVIEAPDVPIVGVGEGTWPTIRLTLATIGLDEGDFLAACDGAFKQASRFDGWVDGSPGDSFLHPFTTPPAVPTGELLAAWQAAAPDQP
ncbi:MAG: tryptophan 7-halogenase, partial [Sphingopyxis sp.]